MKLKYNRGGRTGGDPVPMESGDPVRDYIARVGGPQSIQNTFGPADYIAGAFPIARVLSPYLKPLASKVMGYLGQDADAGARMAQKAFSDRFGMGAIRREQPLMKELRQTATTREIQKNTPYSGMDVPSTQELLGVAKAAPPTRPTGIGGGATRRQTEGLLANEMEVGAIDELINKFLNDPLLMAERKSAMGDAVFYDKPYSMLEKEALTRVEGMLDKFGQVIDPSVATNKAGKRFLAEPPRGGKDIDFPNLRPRYSDRFMSPQVRMDDAVNVVKEVDGDILQQLARAYKRQGY
jgi:hypothetical protein